jgi:hypothetical protein
LARPKKPPVGRPPRVGWHRQPDRSPAVHNPAATVTASQSSARHQGAEQRKRGPPCAQPPAPGSMPRDPCQRGTEGVDRVDGIPAGQGRIGGKGSSSRPAFPSSSTRHPRGACRDKAMRRWSAATTDDRLLTPRPTDTAHSSRLVTDDSNFRTSSRSNPGTTSDSSRPARMVARRTSTHSSTDSRRLPRTGARCTVRGLGLRCGRCARFGSRAR